MHLNVFYRKNAGNMTVARRFTQRLMAIETDYT